MIFMSYIRPGRCASLDSMNNLSDIHCTLKKAFVTGNYLGFCTWLSYSQKLQCGFLWLTICANQILHFKYNLRKVEV